MRILIVEDDPAQRRVFCLLQRRLNLDALDCVDGQEAQTLDWPSYDLAFVDVMMPVLSGDDLIRWAAKKFSDLPNIILFSVLPDETLSALQTTLSDEGIVTSSMRKIMSLVRFEQVIASWTK